MTIITAGSAGAASCTTPAAAPAPDKYLVTATLKNRSAAEDLKKGYGAVAAFVKNGFASYRIVYNTTMPDGKPVKASGALFVPDVKGALPLFNYNHGTIFPSQEKSAPSYLQDYNAELGIAKLFAANGYFAVVPDYIGYGESKNAAHPYGAYNIIAAQVVDMLHAAKEFAAAQKISLTGKNFFSGWSEGAAVALATVKNLEESGDKTLTPTATVLNAGPYYSSAFVDHILDSNEPLKYMNSYVWVLRSYNTIYHINKPADYYFNKQPAAQINNGNEYDITNDPQKLFNPAFKQSFKAGKDTALAAALRANDLWDWKPASPVIFCHGDADEYVPVFNSEKAYKEMKAKGANVELKIFKGQNHTSGVYNFLQTAYSAFESKK